MTEQLIVLPLVYDNPYQPRITDNAEHVENLARSIAADGLLQKPAARKTADGNYELAFGHSRRKAFEWLNENWKEKGLADRYEGYTRIPLEVKELTDEEMYRHAISENVQRKDLTPIEVAKAMLVYRDQFKASSEATGELFGMNGATVRGLIRLLDLPASIQEKIASGEITQNAARKLLTIARIDVDMVEAAAEEIASGSTPDDVIEKAMRDRDMTTQMWHSWDNGKPRGGKGLWPLDTPPEKFPAKYLPVLKAADVAKALDMDPSDADLREKIEKFVEVIQGDPARLEGYLKTPDAALYERIAHLLNPPACTACPYHAVVDKSHYCGFKFCHERKRKTWVAAELQRLSKHLHIPVYDPAVDGKDFLPLQEHSYSDHYKAHAALVKAKDADLRLQPNKDDYSPHQWTDSHHVRLVLVGKKLTAVKEKQLKYKEKMQTSEAQRQQEQQRSNALRDASQTFQQEYVFPLFGQAFKGCDNIPALAALARVELRKNGKKPAEVLATLRAELADQALDHLNGYDWQLMWKGPVALAKFLLKVAPTWGVKLPADFLTVAQGYQDAVAVETEKE